MEDLIEVPAYARTAFSEQRTNPGLMSETPKTPAASTCRAAFFKTLPFCFSFSHLPIESPNFLSADGNQHARAQQLRKQKQAGAGAQATGVAHILLIAERVDKEASDGRFSGELM